MATDVTRPRVEDLVSVGSRISWGAIMAGTVVALGLQFLLAVLGAAVGVSLSNRVDPDNLEIAAVTWSIVITCAALFVGGLVTSQFTVGENKMEAMLYGIIMWAVLFVVLLSLGAAGASRWSAMVGMAELAQTASAESWESAARRAGIPADRIAEFRDSLAGTEKKEATASPAAVQAANQIAWYAFAGTWLSMIAAALGALVGAGPTFRLATVAVPAPHIIR